MIDELILKEKESSINKLKAYESNVHELKKLEEMKNNLASKLKELSNGFGNNSIGVIPFFREEKFNAFQKRFSRKYKDYLKRKEQYEQRKEQRQQELEEKNKEIENLKKQIKDIELKIDELSNEIEGVNIDDINEKITRLQDKETAIEVLVQEDESLCHNIEFMKEAITIDSEFIRYDRTDNPELYIKVLEIAREEYTYTNTDSEKQKEEMKQKHSEVIDAIIEEIKNPKTVDDGKYKIPIKYIFEGIREDLETAIDKFSRFDGTFPKEFGEELQRMYEDEENIFAVHSISRNYDATTEGLNDMELFEAKKTAEDTVESIFQKGLRATNSMGELSSPNANPEMAATTYAKGQKGFCFLKALDYKYAGGYGYILIQVPKKGIGKDAEIAIWGSKTNEKERAEKVFLLPQYIKGFVENNRQVKNEDYCIRKNDCKDIEEYPYYLMDGSYRGKGPALKTQRIKKEVTPKDIAETDKSMEIASSETFEAEQMLENLIAKEKVNNNG